MSTNRRSSLVLSTVSATSCLVFSLSGLAQTQSAENTELMSETGENTQLEEVIVTATKRNELLGDVPISISLVEASVLESQQLFRLQDYFSQIPGVQLSAGASGSLQLAVRGITTGGSTNPTVATTIDDVPIGSSSALTYAGISAIDLDPADLERVEVLRGPQGTLYGASSLGGLIRYVTARPKINEFTGRFQLDGMAVNEGSAGYSGRAFLNLPLAEDTLAATVSAFYRRDPGIVDDPTFGLKNVDSADVWGGRVSALWEATEDVSLHMSALYQSTEGNGSSNIFSYQYDKVPDELTQVYLPGTGQYSRKISQFSAALDINLDWASLTSITAYGRSDAEQYFDVTNFLGFITYYATGRDDLGSIAYQPTDVNKFSQEVRLTSPNSQTFEWLLGLFYTDEDADTEYNIFAADPVSGALLENVFPDVFPFSYKEKAIFGSGTYHFTERFDLGLGARWSENRQVFDETIGGPLFDPPYMVHAESKDHSFTYVVSPQYEISPEMMVYGRLATGYRPGGPNPGAGFGTPTEYDADTTISYELGWKAGMLDNHFVVDASVYYIDWTDIQLQQRDPVTEFLYYTNAGSAESKGADINLTASTDNGLRVLGTLAFNDSTLSDATNGGVYGEPGDRLPFSAKFSSTLSLDKEFALGSSYTGFVGGTLTFLGERYGSFPATPTAPRVTMPSYTTLDLRMGILKDDWTLTLFVRNLFDERGIIGSVPELASGASNLYLLNIIRPRSIGLVLVKDL